MNSIVERGREPLDLTAALNNHSEFSEIDNINLDSGRLDPKRQQQRRPNSKRSVKFLPATLMSFALGSVSLGLSWQAYLQIETVKRDHVEMISHVFAIVSAVFWCSYVPKILFAPKTALEDVLDFAALPALTSGAMSLANYAAVLFKFSPSASHGFWIASAVSHLTLMAIYVIARAFRRESFKEVFFPYCFVSTVGIGAVAATGKPQHPQFLAKFSLWLSFAWLCALYLPVIVRLLKYEMEPTARRPAVGVLVAPINLVLAAKLAIEPEICTWMNHVLFYWGVVTFLYGAVKIVGVLRPPFVSAHAGLTFPLNISTIATLRFHEWTGSKLVLIWGTILLTIATLVNLAVLVLGGIALVRGNFLYDQQQFLGFDEKKKSSLVKP